MRLKLAMALFLLAGLFGAGCAEYDDNDPAIVIRDAVETCANYGGVQDYSVDAKSSSGGGFLCKDGSGFVYRDGQPHQIVVP